MLKIIKGNDKILSKLFSSSFFKNINNIISTEKNIVIGLSGGKSSLFFFNSLMKYKKDLAPKYWRKLYFFWVDERLVSPLDKESNFGLANQNFLTKMLKNKLIIPKNIHRFQGETSNIKKELYKYSKEIIALKRRLEFDILLLGVGWDGHIASIFPGRTIVNNEFNGYFHIEDSPKPPPNRISISPESIKSSKIIYLFFLGDEKKNAFEKFNDLTIDSSELPAKLVLEGNSKVYIITNITN